jgi:cytochrome b561
MLTLRITPQRYNNVAILLHWAIAACILLNLALGFFMEDMPPQLRGPILLLHFSAGITVLPLTLIRIAWRLSHKPPPLDPNLRPYEVVAAHLVHGLLYLGMLLMPLIGWAIISAHPAAANGAYGPPIWGVFPLPLIQPLQVLQPALQTQMHANFVLWHSIGAFTLLTLLTLHVGGALKHQFADGLPELQRMMFRRGSMPMRSPRAVRGSRAR